MLLDVLKSGSKYRDRLWVALGKLPDMLFWKVSLRGGTALLAFWIYSCPEL